LGHFYLPEKYQKYLVVVLDTSTILWYIVESSTLVKLVLIYYACWLRYMF
jgi:hypothetical protein